MKHEKAKEKFLNDFKIKYPNYKILKLTKLSSEIIVEDDKGWIHRKSNSTNTLKYNFNIQSIVEKEKYVQHLLNLKFGNLKLISFNGVKNSILVEDEFGFRFIPQCYDLLKGSKVTIETCTEKEKLFIFKAKIKHNNFYSYHDFIYKNGKTKVNINCPIHGDFEQICESHLYGHGCPKCNKVGFSKESWIKKVKNKPAYFYVLKVYNENEEFIKIGITSKTVKNRYANLKDYKYEIIKIIEGDASKVYDLEKSLLKKLKLCKYLPNLPFEGWTECFNIVYLDKIINYEIQIDFNF